MSVLEIPYRDLIVESALRDYIEYNQERTKVYYLKEVVKAPPPWTDHPQISVFKFTNTRRELDRQTKWLINRVILNDSMSLRNKLLNCALFRGVNLGEAMDNKFGGPIDFDAMSLDVDAALKHYLELERNQKSGIAEQSNAYFLSSIRKSSNSNCRDEYPELQYTTTGIIYLIWCYADVIVNAAKLDKAEDTIDALMKVPSLGDFMAYQIWVDFTYIPGWHQTEDDCVVSGPGCTAGILWIVPGLMEYIKQYGWHQTLSGFMIWFRDNLPELAASIGMEWDPKKMFHFLPEHQQVWNLMNVENSWCEFSKLMKLKNNVPMRKRYFRHG